MERDGYYNFLQNRTTSLIFESLSLPLILLFIMPIYEFSKTRTPMFLLFSKSLALASNLFVAFIGGIMEVFPTIHPNWWIYVLYVNNVPYLSIRLHLLAMALNRFISVYFPFKYQKFNKRAFIRKACFTFWMAAFIFTPPSLFIGLNQIKSFPLMMLLRSNIEHICIYSALLFYILMSAKLIWIRFHLHPALEGNNNVLEKDYCKISTVCIVSILPFLLGILALTLRQSFIAAGIYEKNYLLQDILITLNAFLRVANFSEEICLLILSADFRAIFMSSLFRNADRFLKAITFGRFTLERPNFTNNENDLLNNNGTNNGTNTISNNGVLRKCRILEILRRNNNRIGVAPQSEFLISQIRRKKLEFRKKKKASLKLSNCKTSKRVQ